MTDFVSKRRKTKGKVREVSSREAKREEILYSFSLWQIDRGVLGFAYRACDGRGGQIKKRRAPPRRPPCITAHRFYHKDTLQGIQVFSIQLN